MAVWALQDGGGGGGVRSYLILSIDVNNFTAHLFYSTVDNVINSVPLPGLFILNDLSLWVNNLLGFCSNKMLDEKHKTNKRDK